MWISLDNMMGHLKNKDSKPWWSIQSLLVICIFNTYAQADIIDAMSRQFFGLQSEDHRPHQNRDDFSQMFGANQNEPPRRDHRYSQHDRHKPPPRHPPPNHHRQGYYSPPPSTYYAHHPAIQPHPYPHPHVYHHHPQVHPQTTPTSNETNNSTQSPGARQPQHPHGVHYAPVPHHVYEAVQPHAYPHSPATVEYHAPPETIVEYHHPPPEHHHEEVHEYHHYPTHKPKRFHLSYNEPTPELKIIDKHLKLPPVKFRFHINPKIVITSNTKDPLEKEKHHDHHDIEPYPPPDAFSDHGAPPSYNEHVKEIYPAVHHYAAVEEHHYPVHGHHPPVLGHHPPVLDHHPPVLGHHPPVHYPIVDSYGAATYDLSHKHGYINPHRSSGHYEPTFKIKTKPIIFTEPPPTRGTTTTTTRKPTTTTERTTTTTRASTTRRPRSRPRARQTARNPDFSFAFTQTSTAASNVEPVKTSAPSSTEASSTRRSIVRSGDRERNDATPVARKDTGVEENESTISSSTSKLTTTATTRMTTVSTTKSSTTTTTASTTTPSTTSKSTTISTTPSTTTRTTTPSTTTRTTTTSTTTTPRSTTQSTSTTTTPRSTTQSTSTTPRSTTQSTSTTEKITTRSTTQKPITTPVATSTSAESTAIPAEMTTARRRTFNVDANEIDMKKVTESPRRRLEPLLEEAETTLQNSESVKIIETTMMIDGKNQTVRFYYITQPVKLPPEIFHQMIGHKNSLSGAKMLKFKD